MVINDRESTPLMISPKGGGRLAPRPTARSAANAANAAAQKVIDDEMKNIVNPNNGRLPTRRRNGNIPASLQNGPTETHYFSGKFDPPPPDLTQQEDQSEKRSSIGNNNKLFSIATKSLRSAVQSISKFCGIVTGTIKPLWEKGPLSSKTKTNKINTSFGSENSVEHYEDNYNDLPYQCTFGTSAENGIWLNYSDQPGLIMSSMVSFMIIYSGFTVTLLANHNSLNSIVSATYCTICALALSCHAKTQLTDPGSIPSHNSTHGHAVPTEADGANRAEFPMCSVCETYKPPRCHHCRICNRCIAGMDHHCPWMNNCIGTGNLKHFFLFLIYVWMASFYALLIFGFNYFFCGNEECIFPNGLVHLVRIMTLLCVGALIFTSNMIVSVLWGIMTGMGTIDRLKKQELDTIEESEEEPVPWTDVFGIGAYWTWILPIDPLFDDYDRVMGYASTQRLLREKNMSMI